MSFMFSRFGTIAKVEEQADGTIKVYGIASTGSRDTAGEIVKPEAMAAALPDYSRFPALREMHQPSAAGKVLEADVDGEGVTNIVAHVVDPLAITKVKTGVYAGFSIGGKVTARDPKDRSVITGLRLVEISLVDSPCNPDAILSMWKADMSIYTPPSEAVVARAKDIAKRNGSFRFSEFLFEAREELVADYMLEKGTLDVDPGSVTTETGETSTEEPGADNKDAAATAGPDEEDHAGEGNEEPAATAEEGKEAAAEVETTAVETATETTEADDSTKATETEPVTAEPAAALAAALEKGATAAETAAAPVADETATVEAPAGPFADFGKAAAALKGITTQSPLAKSLYHVSRMADLLESFANLHSCVAMEAGMEGDNSPVPGEIKAQVTAMGSTLVAMAQEEVAEMLSELSEGGDELPIEYVGDEVALATEIVDLVKADTDLMEKAGKRHSKGDMAAIQAAHDAMAKLGAACDIENCNKADDAEAISKADSDALIAAKDEEIAALNEQLTKAAPAVEEIVTKFTGTIDTLKGELAELRKRFEDEPLPAKTAGPAAVTAIGKGADSTGNAGAGTETTETAPKMTDEQFEKAWGSLSEEERGLIMLKVQLSRPQQIISRQTPRVA